MKRLKLFLACMLMAVFGVGNVWGATADVTYDFTGSGWTVSSGTLSNGTVSFTGSGPDNFKMNSGYFIMGKSGAYINFPTYASAVEKIVVTGRSGASGSVVQNIFVGDNAVSTATTGATGTNTYNIASGYQAAGTTYKLKVTSGHNTQVTKIEVFFVSETPTCATPTFDPEGGEFSSNSIDVEIATTTDGATIYYTTDGTNPTTSSSVYSSALNITETTTVKAMAVKTGANNSAVASATYTKVASFDGLKLTFDVSANPGEWPTTNPTTTTNYTYTLNSTDYTFALNNVKCNNGYLMLTYVAKLGLPAIEGYKLVKVEATNSSGCSTSTKVKITEDEAGSTVVTGGAEQTWSTTSTKYTYTLSGTEAETMYYLYVSNKNCQIVTLVLYYEEVEAPLLPKAAKPTFESGDENFVTSTSVTLACTTEGAKIYYTTNGDEPTTSSTLYEGAIPVSTTTTIKAIAVADGYDKSTTAEKTFTQVEALQSLAALLEATTSTETGYNVVISDWVVTGAISNRAWISNAENTKGILLYKSGHGFTAGKKLNGVVIGTKAKIYQGYPELTSLLASEVTVSDAAEVTPRTTTLAALASGYPTEQGTLVKLENVTYAAGTGFSDGTNTVALHTQLYGATMIDGATYNIIGVVRYDNNAAISIMPRSVDDVEQISGGSLPEVDGLAELKAETVGASYLVNLTDAVVTLVSGNNAFIEDATAGALIFYSGHGLAAGDKLNGQYEVTTATYQGKFEITAMEAQTGAEKTSGAEIPVTTLTIAQLNANFAANESKRIKIVGANVTDAISGSDRNGSISDGAALAVYAGVASTITLAENDNVDIIGYPGFHNTDQQLTVWAQADITVNSTPVESKNVVIIAEYDSKFYALTNSISNKTAAAVEIEKDGSNIIVTSAEAKAAIQWKKIIDGENTTFQDADDKYLKGTSGGGDLTVADAVCNWSWNATDEYYYIGTRSFIYRESANGFKNYSTQNAGTSDYSALAEVIEIDPENIVVVAPATLESIVISGTASNLEYTEGQAFNPAGLVVTGHYSDNSDAEITTGIDWAFDPATLSVGDASVSVIATVGEVSSTAFVVNGLTVSAAVAPANVVIIAEYDSKFYALTNSISNKTAAAVEIEKDGSNIIVTSAEAKAAIQWKKIIDGENTTFQDADDKYLKGTSGGGDLTVVDAVCNWSWNATDEYYYIGTRSFIYRESANGFKNYSTQNAGTSDYSALAEVIEIDPENIVITSKVDPQLAFNPTSVELTVGGSFTPATLNYAEGFDGLAAVTYASSNTDLATVEGNVVSLVADATGTTTITASFPGNENYLSGSASYTISVNEAGDDLSGTWTRVTSVAAGQKIIIAGTYNEKTMAMGKQNSNNRAAVLSTLDGDVLTPGAATKVFTLVDAGEGLFAIEASNGKYLNAAGTGSSNYLREADDYEAASAKWTITFDENGANIVATSTDNRNVIRYNSTNNSELFSCYAAGGQRAINIYSTSAAPEPVLDPIAPIGGKFIINQYGDTAVFSRGNLQYQQSTNTWRCAPNQYNWQGMDNLQMGNAAYEGWVDLFCWSLGDENNYGATSAYLSTAYQNKDFVDWGGLFQGDWATLSSAELKYLLNTRSGANDKWGMAMIEENLGMILLPDEWSAPSGVTFVPRTVPTSELWDNDDKIDNTGDHYRVKAENMPANKFTLAQWAELEEAGAVFLPFAGRRSGGYGNHTNSKDETIDAEYNYTYYENYLGTYWTSTLHNAELGQADYFYSFKYTKSGNEESYDWGKGVVWSENGRYGQSVRLAHIIPRQYTVTYNANGADGEVPTDANKYLNGANVPLASASGLQKEGHVFAGWKFKGVTYAGTEYTIENVLANEEIVFEAQWELDYTTIRAELYDGKWGTICPKQKILQPIGASFYKLTYMDENGDGTPYRLFFDEIAEGADLEAGKPYLFIAEGAEIKGVKVGVEAEDGHYEYNGFCGYLGAAAWEVPASSTYDPDGTNYYGLTNNTFTLLGEGCLVPNERAYVKVTATQPTRTPSAPVYGRRRVVAGNNAPSVATGMDALNASEQPMKMMIDGQLFIIRGEKMFDATGRLVK